VPYQDDDRASTNTRVSQALKFVSTLPTTVWIVIVTATGLGGFLLVRALPFTGFNSTIYAAIGTYFREYGELPAPDAVVGPDGIQGSYADFPAINLWMYRLLLGWESSEAWWAMYQILPTVIAAALLGTFGARLGLNIAIARLSSIIALGFATYVAIPGEDKTNFWWLPVIALLVATTTAWGGAALMGLFAGWTGLAPLAVTLSAIGAHAKPAKRIALLVTSVLVAACAVLAVGDMTVTLWRNRAMRESSEAFWFSVWQFAGPMDFPLARTVFVAVLSAAVLFTFARKLVTLPATLVTMMSITLLASNSTVPTRVMMVLPLGVFIFHSVRIQLMYLGGILLWAVPIGLTMLLNIGYEPSSNFALRACQVLWVNAPLLILVLAWARNLRHLPRTASATAP